MNDRGGALELDSPSRSALFPSPPELDERVGILRAKQAKLQPHALCVGPPNARRELRWVSRSWQTADDEHFAAESDASCRLDENATQAHLARQTSVLAFEGLDDGQLET